MFNDFPRLGINIFRIDISRPLEDQQPVDAIFHKLIDQLSKSTLEDRRIVEWYESTRSSHPDLLFIDSLDKLEDFLDRFYTYEVGEEAICLTKLQSILSVPEYFLLPKGTSVREAMRLHHISVPVLIKPQWTTGDPASHAIDIILEQDAIPDSYPIDMVVQSYRDHDGVIFKVYAVEDTVFIEKRYSLPNVANCENLIQKYTIDRLKKCPESFSSTIQTPTKDNEIISGRTESIGPLSLENVRSFVVSIETILHMGLLGVDLIVDAENPQQVYCIDINLFPSFTGFPNVSEVVGTFILKRIATHSS
ncbi:inositol-tetrakisphosphate 1-kinase 3 [Blastocystis sp. subtype 4]|uniref:inositol-tetrakisphosphate 1-kinase 3 n=1 Tax=Blastocystis sp. subtype 4 TaxID=944170 RepID=UPI000711EA36|nr:inositol-tetrakisphosphate 1-kinase 3 [Blastocystis sp. subtype 4]KNB41650.1 inositol-tetrakisphosphate 1-kinase 3 [Blastocystis sp. subtype 4]|eukprot:XP_014525093.1 inositol-tetrakisphosphate 1-kinase 3 [Blastocystis sp. subtype 4]